MKSDPWFPIAMLLVVLLSVWLGIAGPLPLHGGWLDALEHHHGLASWAEAFGVVGALVVSIVLWRADRRREYIRQQEAVAAAVAAITQPVHAAAAALSVFYQMANLTTPPTQQQLQTIATAIGYVESSLASSLIRDILPQLAINERLLAMMIVSTLQTFCNILKSPSPALTTNQRYLANIHTLTRIRLALRGLDADLADVFDRDGGVPPGTPY